MSSLLSQLGWDVAGVEVGPGLVPARVACGHRDMYTLLGLGDEPVLARVSGRLRFVADGAGDLPAVGDWVGVSGGVIRSVLPRRTVIARADPGSGARQVLAANVDVVFVVTSVNRELNARRLERFVALAVSGGAECVVVLNKADLVEEVGAALGEVRAAVGGETPVVVCSAVTGDGLDVVSSWLSAGRTVALLGTSGVGKSTLTNALLGADVQETAPIRAVDDRGRHTTVRRELLMLPSGALLIDTPGLKLPRMEAGTVVDSAFDEITALAASCRYADCTHSGEPGCAVADAVAAGTLDPGRLDALRALAREQAWADSRDSAEGQAKRKRRARQGSRALRRYYQDRSDW